MDGYTAEDLDHIPDLPPHTQLIDGRLVFPRPQNNFHSLTLFLLESNLRRFAPDDLRIRRQMTVTLSTRQRPEPDVLVVRAEGDQGGMGQNDYRPEYAVLVIEVVSPDSETRDRERKPQLYAQAGIPHFWRIEESSGRPTVYVYELDPASKAYTPTGIYHDRVKLSVPFDIDIDLTEIDRL
jgi:Uma2 family endonuclease